MDQVPASGNVTVDGDLHATNVITGIQYNVTVMFPQPFTPPLTSSSYGMIIWPTCATAIAISTCRASGRCNR
jgi:hypothetical protein